MPFFFVRRLADKIINSVVLTCSIGNTWTIYMLRMSLYDDYIIITFHLAFFHIFGFFWFTALFRSVPYLFLSARQHSISVVLLTILRCLCIEQFFFEKISSSWLFSILILTCLLNKRRWTGFKLTLANLWWLVHIWPLQSQCDYMNACACACANSSLNVCQIVHIQIN